MAGMPLARLLTALLLLSASLAAQNPLRELRGVYLDVSDGVFASRAEISKAMEALADAHVNVVLPCVWDGAFTLWHSSTAKEAFGADCDPAWGDRDVLGELVMEAHRFGLEVLPCFDAGFTAKGALLDKHPDWAALGKDKQPVTRNGERWLDALHPDVQQFFLALVLELARNYDLDGFAGSERFPALPAEAGYDARTLAAYKQAAGVEAPRDEHEAKWSAWRAEQLTGFRAKLGGALHPSLALLMAPRAPGVGLRENLQDVKSWSERKLCSAIVLRAAAHGSEDERKLVGEMLTVDWLAKEKQKFGASVATLEAGWKADSAFLVAAIENHRREQLAGEILVGARALLAEDGALAHALWDGPYNVPAIPPWRSEEGWRPKPLELRPEAGYGRWSFAPGDGPQVMLLDGGQKGEASWTARARFAGAYDVYAWIPSEPKLGEQARYQLATSHGLATSTLKLDAAKGRGWRWLGVVRLPESDDFEVARYDAIEADRTKVSAIGPLLLILNRRAGRG